MPDILSLGVFSDYEQGKHRRYSLLFSVNGGAFAITQLLAKFSQGDSWSIGPSPAGVANVMITVLVVLDIYTFGKKMRKLQNDQRAAGDTTLRI